MNAWWNYDIETWKQFLEQHWIVLALAIVVLLIILRVVKTVLKWALVAVIVVGILIYSGYTLNDLSLENLKSIGTQVADNVRKEAMSAMVGEGSDAVFTDNGDGTFTVRTANVELNGTIGGDEVAVSFRGASLGSWQIDETIAALIEQARARG